MEDFEDAPDGAPTDCSTLLNATTDDDCFQPGELPTGVDIRTTTNGILIASSPGFQGLPGNMIAPNIAIHMLRLEFRPAVRAVGFNQYTFAFGSPDPQTISLFKAGDEEIASVVSVVNNSGVFFGIESDEPITAMEIHSPANSPEFIDNLRFQPASANDNIIFYPDEASFDTRFPGLPVEDFEDAKPGNLESATCSSIVRHSTVDDCFDFADILGGIEIKTVNNLAIAALGTNTLGVSSKTVGPNVGIDQLRVEFPLPITALGLNQLTASSGTPDTPTLRIFDVDGNELLNMTTNSSDTGEFLGFRSRIPVGAIEVHSVNNHPELLDDVRFLFAEEDDCYMVFPKRNRPLPVCF